MDNMEFWGKLQNTPAEARKPIQAGRLKGMTDINPMWRFKVLTKTFGPCGIGWKYQIIRTWTETGLDNEVKAFVEVNLFIKFNGEWSEAIPGVGGSSFVTVERNGPYCSDECYKMALTDAISVCCKALGMSADIYFEKDRDKYTAGDGSASEEKKPSAQKEKSADNGPAPGRQTSMTPAPPAEQTKRTGKCRRCKAPIDAETESYTRQRFKMPLCRACQAAALEYEQKQKEQGGAQ